MVLYPKISRAVLTSHITFSLGWGGAIAVFIALAITGLTNQNDQVIRACLIAMDITARYVIVPLCLASLLTGIIQSIFTKWGLFRHYWIVVKLLLTLGSTVLLFLHLKPISSLAGVALSPNFSSVKETGSLINILSKAGLATLVLLLITTISVYKPWGRIIRSQQNSSQPKIEKVKKNGGLYFIIAIAILFLFILVKHLLGGGMQHH